MFHFIGFIVGNAIELGVGVTAGYVFKDVIKAKIGGLFR